MPKKIILELVKEKIVKRLQKEQLLGKKIILKAKVLSTQEAIGNPEKYDFPLLKGCEKIIEANFNEHIGHAFTDMYGGFEGSLQDVFKIESSTNYSRALQVAAINALVNYWGLVKNTIHCKNKEPSLCARQSIEWVKKNYPGINKITFIGYQPALVDIFSKKYALKVLDLDQDNIGKKRFGNVILDGNYLKDAVEWSEVVLATGSTLVNGTIDEILDMADSSKVIFYGVTISGVANVLKLNRLCFAQDVNRGDG